MSHVYSVVFKIGISFSLIVVLLYLLRTISSVENKTVREFFSDVSIRNFMIFGALLLKEQRDIFDSTVETMDRKQYKKIKFLLIVISISFVIIFNLPWIPILKNHKKMTVIGQFTMVGLSFVYTFSEISMTNNYQSVWHGILTKEEPNFKINLKDKISGQSARITHKKTVEYLQRHYTNNFNTLFDEKLTEMTKIYVEENPSKDSPEKILNNFRNQHDQYNQDRAEDIKQEKMETYVYYFLFAQVLFIGYFILSSYFKSLSD